MKDKLEALRTKLARELEEATQGRQPNGLQARIQSRYRLASVVCPGCNVSGHPRAIRIYQDDR
jgi:hypothetical protein